MDSSAVIHIPARLSFAEGAAVPMGFATAHYSLVTLANLQEGESVLIHSGAGGVGQAAIQIAQRLKARIYTSVGTEEKKRLLTNRYNIPIEHIFNSRTDDFAQVIMSKTGTGVDVVLNSLSGDQQLKSWKCIAPLGRFIELGKADMVESQRGLPMGPFLKNVTFSSVSLDVVMAKSTATMRKIMRAVDHMFADTVNPARVPFPLHKYTVGQIEQAVRFMQGGKSSGKIAIEMSRSDQVAVLRSSKPSYSFDSNATYVIAGGLGGLGHSIIEWMVSRNAKNFLVLTRSGALNNEAAMRLIKRMREAGVKIEVPCCDITDDAKVAFTLGQSMELLPPVRGCIQATIVLQDGLLEQMTAASFNEALRPKTLGTINLARNLPESLEFFVLLSSIASVTGSRAQANYAAANAFQDAFARQRVASGHHCVSLNLGAILSVGYAAERNLAQSLRQSGFEGVQEAEFLALLDYACDPECAAAKQPQTAQIVSGLASAETLPGEQFRSVYWAMKPMFKGLRQLSFTRESSLRGTAGVGNDAAAQVAPSVMLASAPNKAVAVDIVKNAIANRFSTLMAIALSDIDTRKAVSTFGIDSLVSLELKTWIAREFKADTSVLDILGAAGIEDLAMTVVRQSKLTMELKNDIEVDG